MGNIPKGSVGTTPNQQPPTVRMQLLPTFPLSIPVTGPHAEVAGFSMPVAHIPTQDDADSLSGKFQTLYDALPESQKLLMAALMGQAADYSEQMWSASESASP